MQLLVPISIALIAIIVTLTYRKKRDREAVEARLAGLGGRIVRMERAKKGHPFNDTGRGWWAWRVVWNDGGGERTAWVLTTRDGIKEWRD